MTTRIDNLELIAKCKLLKNAFEKGMLGDTTMPEDSHPEFKDSESRLIYFTLPMSLNYQRNSFKLWESANRAFTDDETKSIFDLNWVANSTTAEVREKLLKHRVGLQPNKHTDTWKRISETVAANWQTISNMLVNLENDFLKLRETVQYKHKKGFPYLSGPKIFNYWSYILSTYGNVPLKNRSFIQIAPDTHVIQASIKLGLGSDEQIRKLSRDQLSHMWRTILDGKQLDPIEMHSPLWFWSRGSFKYEVRT